MSGGELRKHTGGVADLDAERAIVGEHRVDEGGAIGQGEGREEVELRSQGVTESVNRVALRVGEIDRGDDGRGGIGQTGGDHQFSLAGKGSRVNRLGEHAGGAGWGERVPTGNVSGPTPSGRAGEGRGESGGLDGSYHKYNASVILVGHERPWR